MVRAAVAALRDPYTRLVAELWARHAPPLRETAPPVTETNVAAPSPVLRSKLGWRP
jgi:hypothetical protein